MRWKVSTITPRWVIFVVCLVVGCISHSLAAQHIPIIFIHGILSSSDTWGSAIPPSGMLGGFMNAEFTYGDDLYYGFGLVTPRFHSGEINIGSLYTISFYDEVTNDFHSNKLTFLEQGYQLKQIIDAVKRRTGYCKVILIGHSMGGLAAREYLEDFVDPKYSNSKDVVALFTIGTPHQGANPSWLASLCPYTACQSLRPDSAELFFLNNFELRGKRGQVPFLGLPRGLRVDLRFSFSEIFSIQSSTPNGRPRFTEMRSSCKVSSSCGWGLFSQFKYGCGLGTGQDESSFCCSADP